MTRENKDIEVFNKVITTLATEAAARVEGISLERTGRRKEAVSVNFLENDRVQVNIVVAINGGYTVPQTVAKLQETVKTQIESTTKYKVHAVNVSVNGVRMEGI